MAKSVPVSVTTVPPLVSDSSGMTDCTTGGAYDVHRLPVTGLVCPATLTTHCSTRPAPGTVWHVICVLLAVTRQLRAVNSMPEGPYVTPRRYVSLANS